MRTKSKSELLTENEKLKEKFSQTFNSSPSPMIISEIESGDIIDVNRSFANMIMYSREELIGKNVFELRLWVNPEDRVKYIKKMNENKKVSNLEIELRTKSGDIKTTLISGEILTIKDKLYLLTSGTDITERKKADKQLRTEKKFIDTALDSQLDTFFLFEPATGKALRWNRAFRDISGYTDEDIARMPAPTSYYSPDDLESTDAFIHKVLVEETDTIELELICKDGCKVPTEYKVSIINDDQGVPKYIISIGRDIRERKQAEGALKESEGKFRRLAENSPDIIYRHRLQSNPGFEYINPAVTKISGYTPEEYYNDPELGFKIIHPDDKAELTKFTTGEYSNLPHVSRWIHKDGTTIWIEDKHSPVYDAEGKLSAIEGVARDITDRKNAEKALRESEKQYRTLVRQTPAVLWTSDENGQTVYISANVEQVYGYTPEEILKSGNRLWFGRIHSEDIASVKAAYETLLKKGSNYDIEYRIQRRDGDWIWLHDRATRSYEIAGTLRADGVFLDITERKSAENALRESERKFREMADLLPQIVYETDLQGNLTFVNKQAYVSLGYSKDDLDSGFNVLQTIVPEDRDRARENMKKIMIGKSLSNIEYTMIRKDGSTFSALVNSNPVFGDNKPLGLRGIIVDITERKLAENKIKESQQRLSSHLGNTPLGSIFWDIDFKVIEWNSSAEKIFGYSKKEALGRHPYSLIVPKEIQGQIDDVFNQLLTQTGGSRSVNENVTKDGKRILCDWYNVAITNIDGEVTGVASLVDDITEQKKTERKLKESRNQLRSLAERLQLIREEERATVAREIHDDLGQTLTALKMDISWMKKNSGMTDEMRASKLDVMLGLTDSTIQTVKRIATELRPGILDDLGLISAIEWQTKEFQNRSGIKCNFEVLADEFAIEEEISIAAFRIFQESLTNIARHSGASKVTVTIKRADDFLLLEISDNGVGISEEQINNAKSLGLIGMNERVSVFKGKLTISGATDVGTTIGVYIPIRKN